MTLATAEFSIDSPSPQALQYASFWQRFCASILDLVVLIPYILVLLWLGGNLRLFELYYLVPSIAFGLWYHVHLVKCYGGTPGKLIMGIRIAKVDGSAPGYREALLRYAVEMVLGFIQSIVTISALMHMSDVEFQSLGFMARAARINELAPSWNGALVWVSNFWIWGEFIVMLTNKRRRAPHDFMAGTVVLRKA